MLVLLLPVLLLLPTPLLLLAIAAVTPAAAVTIHMFTKGRGYVHQEPKPSSGGSVFDWKCVTPPGIHLGSPRRELNGVVSSNFGVSK